MTNYLKHLEQQLDIIQNKNPYVKLLGMKITGWDKGQVDVSMPVIAGKHTNMYNVAHGGALASLADMVMGLSCTTLGKRVVTMEMNMNFIRGASPQEAITARGKVVHNGKTTMVTEAEIVDSNGALIAKVRGTFFVVGIFERQGA